MQEAVVTPSIHAVSRDGARFMVVMIAVAVTLRFALFGCSGVAATKGPMALFSKCAAWLQNTWLERL